MQCDLERRPLRGHMRWPSMNNPPTTAATRSGSDKKTNMDLQPALTARVNRDQTV